MGPRTALPAPWPRGRCTSESGHRASAWEGLLCAPRGSGVGPTITLFEISNFERLLSQKLSFGRGVVQRSSFEAETLRLCSQLQSSGHAATAIPIDGSGYGPPRGKRLSTPFGREELIEIRMTMHPAFSVRNADVSAPIPQKFNGLFDRRRSRVPFEKHCPS
jgi:hypothetical protein